VAKIEITRTELVWPGKYDEHGSRAVSPRVNLPFQVIETVNESRATREALKRPAQTSLFDFWEGDEGETFEEGWRNKLIWGDNALVMSSLLTQYAGKVDLIYIDPPFATGADFNITTTIGDEQLEITKEQSLLEEKAYRDTWGRGTSSYLEMFLTRLPLMHELLSPSGALMIHLDWRVNHLIRALLDETFGIANFRNEIVWSYRTGGASRREALPRKHDTIWLYAKSPAFEVHTKTERQYLAKPFMGSKVDEQGRNYVDTILRDVLEGELLTAEADGSLKTYNTRPVLNLSLERNGYPNQKPEGLLALLIELTTRPGALVADFFVGSGTTAAVAEMLDRRWIACDLGRFGVHTTRKRLMSIEGCRPFEVLNLGKYERQYWQTAAFGERDPQQVLFEYLAFILKLYGASPVAGMQHLHGKKAGAVVHVGSVDAPVTIDEVSKALDECVSTGQQELHVLGWEWEMGLNDTVDQLAVDRKVRMKLLAIPREVMEAQAVSRGDIRFFELAHLDCAIETQAHRLVAVGLTGFAMSGADGLDPDVLASIERWSDFVDYWAADWDFRNDTFVNGWVAYRTKKERRLLLKSDPHTYQTPGTYRIAVKVVDIFGNDTTKVFPVEVR
jgi:adenine-specific DNA-methyltransferase